MSDVQGRPAGTMSTERRYGIAISVALILGGVYWALTGLTDSSKTTHDSYPVQGDTLRIENSSAEVEVRTGDGTAIQVERQFGRSVFGSEPKEKYDNGKLELKDGGCGFLSFGCRTTYILTVPKDVQVTLKTRSGDVKVSGLSGGADLTSSSADIEVRDVSGSLKMKSSSGDLEAQGLTASSVTTETSSGSAELDFALAPETVRAKASSGDVSIRIPTGDEAYKVETDTSSGDEVSNVKIDPTATRTITAETSSGDVTVEYNH